MRARWALALVVAGVAALTGLAGAASATDPVSLGTGFVADDAGALSASDLAASEDRLAQLESDTQISLYVALVPEFTNPSDRVDWANTVANDNGLGDSQYLLAIATEGRQYTISSSDAGPLTDAQLDDIEQSIVPDLRDGDYAGAIDTAADGIEAAVGSSGGSGGGFFTVVIWIVVIGAVIALIVWLIARRRRSKPVSGGGAGAPELSTKDLQRRAGSALVALDDAVKTSEEELGFAKAQFGDAAAAEFDAALQQARENLGRAFTLNQQLTDSTSDTEEEVRAWNTEIVRLCEEAERALDDKADAFDDLRKLEQNAPQALAGVRALRAEIEPRISQSEQALAGLTARYAASALATVADNPAQARQRLAFADDQLGHADAAVAASDGGQAAVAIRAAEEAVAQAGLLADAIGKLADDLSKGEAAIAELTANLEQDVAAAGALPDPDGRVAGAVAAAHQAVEAARAGGGTEGLAPLQVLRGLDAANTQIDAVIAGVRDAQAGAQRAQQQLGQLVLQAQAQVSAAEDFITSRRGAVGADARTRLAEAGASLVQAQQLQASDPPQALAAAQRANQLAGQSIQLAQNDVGAFQGSGGGMFGGGGGGGNLMGAVLGGIVINSMLGGGSRGGGGFGGGSRSTGSMPRLSPGSFGGGGTRSRRGGGRF